MNRFEMIGWSAEWNRELNLNEILMAKLNHESSLHAMSILENQL